MNREHFIDTYRNLITKQTPLSMEEVVEFINETVSIYSPKHNIDSRSLQTLIQTGLIELVINACISVIGSNPDLFNITTLQIYQNNSLIKTYVYGN